MQPEYKFAEHLSVVKCMSNRRLVSVFRTGCHGLRVETRRWADGVHLNMKDRLCLVCKAMDCIEGQQHVGFDCPVYSPMHIRAQLVDLMQHCCAINATLQTNSVVITQKTLACNCSLDTPNCCSMSCLKKLKSNWAADLQLAC